jgi:hypothetical protein
MPIVKFKKDNSNNQTKPTCITNGEFFYCKADSTYVGWSHTTQVPNDVFILTKQDMIDRLLFIHKNEHKLVKRNGPGKDGIQGFLTDQEVITEATNFYDRLHSTSV